LSDTAQKLFSSEVAREFAYYLPEDVSHYTPKKLTHATLFVWLRLWIIQLFYYPSASYLTPLLLL